MNAERVVRYAAAIALGRSKIMGRFVHPDECMREAKEIDAIIGPALDRTDVIELSD